MKKILAIFPLFVFFVLFLSCNNKSEKSQIALFLGQENDSAVIITNKIMYDVPIVNLLIGNDRSKNNRDWFWENIPCPDCQNFTKGLLEDVKSGRLPIYEYDLVGTYDTLIEVPSSELDDFLESKLTYNYETYDTVKKKLVPQSMVLDENNIKEIRFLEEWYIKDGEFHKKVVAFAPFFTINDPNFSQEQNTIFFWVRLKRD
jgi:hypothetical protein